MRKLRLNIFIITLFVASNAIFSSCGNEDDSIDSPYIEVRATYVSQILGGIEINDILIPNGGEIKDYAGTEVRLKITLNSRANKLYFFEIISKKSSEVDGTELGMEEIEYKHAKTGLFEDEGKWKSPYEHETIIEDGINEELEITVHNNVWGIVEYSMKILVKPVHRITGGE